MQTSIPVQPNETAVTAALRVLAGVANWDITHTTDGHVPPSLHCVGRAVDLASHDGPAVDSPALAQIAQDVLRLLPLQFISELIWAGPNPVYVKNGVRVNGLAVYGSTTLAAHHNHVHLAVVPGFTYTAPTKETPTVSVKVNAPAVGIAITPTGNGYIILTADGGIFAFGDAKFIDRVEYTLPAGDDWSPAN